MEFTDTHCHIHEIEGEGGVHAKWSSDGVQRTGTDVLEAARAKGVTRLLVIGTSLADSERAVAFAQAHDGVWASIGIHPHEAKHHLSSEIRERFTSLASKAKVVAVGECGLDYYYNHSPQDAQAEVLRFQLDVAQQHGLPLSFHVRDAFQDFWPIFDEYEGLRGVLHSFTDNMENLEQGLKRGLYVGVNGIATFPSNESQHVIYRTISQQRLLLETDAPFLTPVPFRGKVCEPKHVVDTAEFLSSLRGETLQQLAAATTANAQALFNFK